MSETFNRLWDADDLFGKWGREVREEFNDLQGVDQKLAFIQERLILLLLKNVRDNRLIEYCVRSLKSFDWPNFHPGMERKTGYSRRYLDLLFKQHVGLPPKVLAGIFRFQKYYRKWAQGQSFDLLKQELYEHYYDQAHFSKEFRE